MGIGRDAAREHDVAVDDLEDDAELQDLVLTIFHITSISLGQSGAVKLIENHLGRRFLQQVQVQQIGLPFGLPAQPPQPPEPPQGPAPEGP